MQICCKMPNQPRLILNNFGANYIDYYDHHFDAPYRFPSAPVWKRNSRVFPDRAEQFLSLTESGILTPPYGQVRDIGKLIHNINPETLLVVYTDQSYHQGYGKILIPYSQAILTYPDNLSVKYCYAEPYYLEKASLTGRTYESISRRYLMIGKSAWVLEYASTTDWRSNVGEVDIDVSGELKDQELYSKLIELMKRYRSPIFAIDVVPNQGQTSVEWLATDLNLAPGMHNVGIKEFVGPKQAYQLILDFYYEFCI